MANSANHKRKYLKCGGYISSINIIAGRRFTFHDKAGKRIFGRLIDKDSKAILMEVVFIK